MTEGEARDWLDAHVSRETIAQLDRYIEMLIAETARQNLVSASTIDQIWSRHVVDSLQLLSEDQGTTPGRWIDIGSGAGFPGVIAAIAGRRPVTLVETRPLRTNFLQHVVDELCLDAEVLTARVQDVEGDAAIISARAVVGLDKLFAWAHHLSRSETVWLLPKGKSARWELADAQRAWQGVFHVKQSVTDPEAGIIVARNVRRRRG